MNSQNRILRIFILLLSGEKLTKTELINEYQKKGVTIQRDISIIEEILDEYSEKSFFKNNKTSHLLNFGTLNREEKGYYHLTQLSETSFFTDNELLLIMKILYASRSLNNQEMTKIANKLLILAQDKKAVQRFIANEQLYYHGVPENDLLDKINFVYTAIRTNQMIEFEYTKNNETHTLRRIPNAIYFSDLYFFMMCSSHSVQDDGDTTKLNKFRINNIVQPRVISTHNKTNYAERFEGGLLRKQTGLPYLGKTTTIILDFYFDPVYVLDRFPDSKIVCTNDDGSFRTQITANDGYGFKMWVLSQGDMVKIISPQSIKDYIIQDMIGALKYYGFEVSHKDK